jgi:PAS domain S-box-containing protein
MSDSTHEAELRRLNRALRMLSDSNQAVIRAADEATLLNEVCRIAVEVGGYQMAWVGLAERDAGKTVSSVAHRGAAAPYGVTGPISWAEGEVDIVPAARAIRARQGLIVHDITSDPVYTRWRAAALGYGYRSMVALPMMADGQAIGALSIYAGDQDAFDDREMEILNELAGDLGYGLNALRIRAERDRATTELVVAQRALQQVLRHAQTTVMHSEVIAPPGWREHDESWVIANVRWTARFEDEAAAQAVMPLELAPGESYYQGWVRAKHRDDNVPMGLTAARAFLSDASNWQQEFRAIDRDGRMHWFAQVASIVATADGHWHITTINTDITARHVAEEAVVAREREFRLLAENTPDFIVRWNRELRRVYVNPAFARATGRPADDLIAHVPGTRYNPAIYAGAPAVVEQVEGTIRGVFADAKAAELEIPWMTVEGRRHYSVRFVPEFDRHGVLLTVLGIGRDITSLKETEQQVRALADNSPDLIARYDRAHCALYINRTAEMLIGVPAAQFIGQEFGATCGLRSTGFAAPEIEVVRRMMDEVFATSHIVEVDIPMRTVEREVTLNVRIVPEVDAIGHVGSVLFTGRDVTALKQAEDERQNHLWHLECMDRVNRAIQGAADLEQMMHDVLDVVLEVFECDRAWLLYPCDPNAVEWYVPMERTTPQYPGGMAAGVRVPMDEEVAALMRAMLAARGPQTFGPHSERPVPVAARAYQVQSFIAAAVHPKVDRPYMFGLHQCSYERAWTMDEQTLFREISRRIADAVTSLITVRSLRESERRMEEAQHIAHVGHWDCDFASGEIRWSDETYRIFGLQPQARRIDWFQLREFIHPDDRVVAMEALTEAGTKIGPFDSKYRIVRPSGEVRTVHARGNVHSSEAPTSARMFGTIQDITESKRIEDSLALFRSLIDHTNVGIEVIDPETGRFVDVNDTTCRAHGYTRAELLSLAVSDLDPQLTAATWPERCAQIRRTGYLVLQSQHRRKDGSVFPVEVSVTYIRLDRDYLLSVVHDITERRRAEEALRESQARLENATRATRIGTWDWNLLTGEVHFSAEWKRQLGYEDHEIVNRYEEWETRLHPEDRERVVPELHAYLAGTRPDYQVEFRLRHRDGSYHWIFTRGELLRSSEGVAFRVIGCHIDISERKQAEEELRRSQQAYASLVNSVDGIVWELEVATFQFTFVSPQAERILGYPVAAWLNEPTFWRDHLHPDDRDAALSYCLRATEEKRDHDFYYRMIAADGRTVWLHDIVTVVVEHERTAKLRGIMVDVTAEKAADEALRWRTALFEAQVDSGLDAILVVDSQGRKILQNRRMAELWKIPPHIADDPDDRVQVSFVTGRTKNPQQFIEKVAHLYAHPDAVSRDEIELADGRMLDRYSAPVRDRTGKYYGRIWSFRDITATKQLEEQLRHSQKMEAVGRLAGGIAHDFNNLLTVIQMQASMLLGEPEAAPGVGQSIQQIMAASERAAILTRQLLTFSRRQDKKAHALDLGEVIGTMAKLVRRILGEDISVETRFAPSLPAVHADPGMMEQVLMNLLVNARDAMPAGGQLTLTLEAVNIDASYVAAHPTARTGRFVCMAVSDTGTGIAPENMSRIFEPFFTTKEVDKGTGLGLAMVFGIVQEHQGWVDVESEVGFGAKFRVFLPAMSVEPTHASPQTAGALASRGTEAILLVEDDPVVRLLAARALERHGYQVFEAVSAVDALQRWGSHLERFDLLVTDLLMPGGMSGQQLADEVRKRRPSLRVLYTSGHNNDAVTRQLQLEAGVNFLPKPYPVRDLLAIVRQRLDQAAS